jgi:uncharacterized repeat protein (TIGR02543 family)
MVTYDANGSTSGTVPTDTNPYLPGDVVTVLGNTGNLVKTGHTFAGWNTQADGKGTGYAEDSTFTIATGDVTLYAQWEINSYTVTFNSNGGTAVGSQSVKYNTAAVRPVEPTKAGHTFAGWYSDEDLNQEFDFATPITGNTTLYAKWDVNYYTVTFASNGGSDVDRQSVQYNTAAARPVDPTKDGHTFAGWYSDEGLTQEFNFETPITGDITLYAKWDINSYTVTFNSNGGSQVNSQSVEYNTAPVRPEDPTKTGHTFAGWYRDEGLTDEFDFTTPITNDITLYAKWTINSYSVTFETNGGTPVPDIQYVEYQNTAVRPAVDPVKTRYTFNGWYQNEECTITFDFNTPIVTDTIVYAGWTANPSYPITYNGNDNTGGAAPEDVNGYYMEGEIVTILGNNRNLLKTGYVFAGWNTEPDANGTSYLPGDTVEMTEEGIVLYAVWAPLTWKGTGSSSDPYQVESIIGASSP